MVHGIQEQIIMEFDLRRSHNEEKDIYVENTKQSNGWWIRKDLLFRAEFNSENILSQNDATLKPNKIEINSTNLT